MHWNKCYLHENSLKELSLTMSQKNKKITTPFGLLTQSSIKIIMMNVNLG